jgi:hypothetical protein
MTGDYPRFKATYTHKELVEHFLVNPADHAVIDTCSRGANRHAVAVLLKSLQYLGYFPADSQQVTQEIRTFIAHQLELLWDHPIDDPWHSSTRDRHLALIRQQWGWRFPTGQDKQVMETWLQTHGAPVPDLAGDRGHGHGRAGGRKCSLPTAVTGDCLRMDELNNAMARDDRRTNGGLREACGGSSPTLCLVLASAAVHLTRPFGLTNTVPPMT